MTHSSSHTYLRSFSTWPPPNPKLEPPDLGWISRPLSGWGLDRGWNRGWVCAEWKNPLGLCTPSLSNPDMLILSGFKHQTCLIDALTREPHWDSGPCFLNFCVTPDSADWCPHQWHCRARLMQCQSSFSQLSSWNAVSLPLRSLRAILSFQCSRKEVLFVEEWCVIIWYRAFCQQEKYC